ncbi:DEAD/DEAH box helicase [Acinetobacter baumannii]|nr:DEAD/DEAH box helicase family protein [Acinetobacter baumannii]AYX86793.1 DEAD/DEAH box helicase [Acinetobacter baumannii]
MGLLSVSDISNLEIEEILDSWKTTTQIYETELRDVQKSALLKCIEYDINKTSLEPAIVNMPTGKGKTGVIAGLIFKSVFKRTLIIVPSDALRTQLADDLVDIDKYKSWGILPKDGLKAKVAKLEPGNLKDLDIDEVNNFIIVVATPQILESLDKVQQNSFLKKFDRLILDEAHHSEAPTWRKLRSTFKEKEKKIFQFTATPYRGDGKKLEGDLIFQYSVSKAFEDKIFEKINFEAIEEFYDSKSDEAIAKKALSILKKDMNQGLEHVLMVKTSTIKHARELKKIYEKYIKNYFNNQLEVLLATSRDGILEEDKNKLKNGETNIVVCVDMFGEGYDLPNLKILALHKKCKSLPIFMQLVGRFTRTNRSKKLGQATIIANIVADDISEQFTDLYAVDADWNLLLGTLSKEKVEKEFFSSTVNGKYNNEILRKLFSSNSFYIKNSAIIYKDITENIVDIFEKNTFTKFFEKNSDSYISAYFNNEELGIILARKKVLPNWVASEDLIFDQFDIFIFLKKEDTLFIHGSNKDIVQLLAKDLSFINYSFPDLFKILYDLERSAFANLGMLSTSKTTRFRMYTGSDVFKELTQADFNNNSLSNLFGHGFIKGRKSSLGCSAKGMAWSMSSANIYEWMKWCESLYEKINDKNIPDNFFIRNMLEPFNVKDLSSLNIIIVTPIDLLTKTINLNSLKADIAGNRLSFEYYDVKLIKHDKEELFFYIELYFVEGNSCRFDFLYNLVNGFSLMDKHMNGLSLFVEDGYIESLPKKLELVAWTSMFEVISLNEKSGYKAKYEYSLESDKVLELDWEGVDINKESWKYGDVNNSVQGKIINYLIENNTPNVLFYDDGSNELADLIGFWIDEESRKIIMRLYHCKYAIGAKSSIGGQSKT